MNSSSAEYIETIKSGLLRDFNNLLNSLNLEKGKLEKANAKTSIVESVKNKVLSILEKRTPSGSSKQELDFQLQTILNGLNEKHQEFQKLLDSNDPDTSNIKDLIVYIETLKTQIQPYVEKYFAPPEYLLKINIDGKPFTEATHIDYLKNQVESIITIIDPPNAGGGKLDKCNVKELKEKAKKRGIKGYSKMNKQDLLTALRSKRKPKTNVF